MPFLRVIRDRRGYETTYLMHWYRDGTRQRSRILYVFRTPGGVRVGRDSLDPQILKDLEKGDRRGMDLMPELSDALAMTSICGLGQAALNPILSAAKHFPGECGGGA